MACGKSTDRQIIKCQNEFVRDDAVVPFKLGQALHRAAITNRAADWPEVSLSLPVCFSRVAVLAE